MRQTQHGQPRKSMEKPTGSREQKQNETKAKKEHSKRHRSCGSNAQCIGQTQHGATRERHRLDAIEQEKRQRHGQPPIEQHTCEAGPLRNESQDGAPASDRENQAARLVQRDEEAANDARQKTEASREGCELAKPTGQQQ